MKDIVFCNLRLEPEVRYFLFVGEFKACCLNEFAARALRRTPGPRVKALSIVPDVLRCYPEQNVVALNPDAVQAAREENRPVALRVPMARFAAQASCSDLVLDLVRQVLKRQDRLDLWMFESRPEMTLTSLPGVRLMGPDPALVARLNDKTWQYPAMSGLVPVVEHCICAGCRELWQATEAMRPRCGHGVFVTNSHSAGGMASMVTTRQEEVRARFVDPAGRYLASRYVPHDFDPTVLGCVGGPGQVYVAGVADMRIENQTMFRGSTWPSALPEDIQAELTAHTRAVGEVLAAQGFRGIFGCDYIVEKSGRCLFVEVNPRKQGTTMEFCSTLERLLPPGAPNLFEMEREAVLHDRLPRGCLEIAPAEAARAGLCWGTYNLKVDCLVLTSEDLPLDMPERDLFGQVALGREGAHLILEHVGQDVLVRPGAFLGRVVAVDATRQGMRAHLARGEARLRRSFAEVATHCQARLS